MLFTAVARSSRRDRFAGLAALALALCMVALAVLSWLPASQLQRTGLGAGLEHFVAYAGTAFWLGVLRADRHITVDLTLLIGYAALLEIGQWLSAGRTASVDDFLYSVAGVVAGRLTIPIIRWLYRRCFSARKTLPTTAR